STDQLPSDLPWEQLPPIYPVVVGSQRSPRDVSVEQVSTSQTNFDAAPVTIRATVRAIGPGERKVVAHLVDENGKELESRTVELPVGEQTATVRFELRPTEAGVSFYDVRATLAQEDPSADEATLANNTRTLVIDRGAGPYRVLYVCGRPNW